MGICRLVNRSLRILRMRFLPFRVTFKTNPLLEQLLNDILAQLRAQRARSSNTVRVKETANGTTHEASVVGAGGSSPPIRLQYVSAFGDYSVCKDPDGNLFPVARPDELRCSIQTLTIEGVIYTYSYEGTGTLQYMRRTALSQATGVPAIEGISPPYIIPTAYPNLTFIYAVEPDNGTGAAIQPGDNTQYSGGVKTALTPITLIEQSQRVWMVLGIQTGEGS